MKPNDSNDADGFHRTGQPYHIRPTLPPANPGHRRARKNPMQTNMLQKNSKVPGGPLPSPRGGMRGDVSRSSKNGGSPAKEELRRGIGTARHITPDESCPASTHCTPLPNSPSFNTSLEHPARRPCRQLEGSAAAPAETLAC
ncbi:hypothetical protein GOP47_0015353 [Adiantum capillus-veneris]|uniref:Uncharacterized protein n=1 Tax=Adiantum capillus-veneris TaxID=13818 RepID=A0A9D4ZCK6_ADICA|nr:hypothetical protein GOP47_0015353 [Adiantum capillus-veneris]